MSNRPFNYKSLAYVVLSIWLALASMAAPTQHAQVPQVRVAATDGRFNGKLVFSSDRQNDGSLKLWTMNADGSNPTQLTFDSERGPTLPDYVLIYDEFCKWSPDGTKTAFRSNRNYDPDNPAPEAYTIYVMDFQSKNVQRLILDHPPILSSQPDAEIGLVDWSPDGKKLAFAFGQVIFSTAAKTEAKKLVSGAGSSSNIYSVNVDGSALTQLTFDGVSGVPAWSPDGNRIAFPTSSGEIDVMNTDGSNRRQIIKIDVSGAMAWSPDGQKLLFPHSESCGNSLCSQLYTVKPDGTELTRLTSSPVNHTFARWSPDGTKIAFVQRLPGPVTSIFVMNADGTGQIEISNRKPKSFQIDDEIDWQPLTAPPNEPPPSLLGFDSGIYLAAYPGPSNVQINVKRSGNLSQNVSCDYQIRMGSLTGGLPGGTLSFAPGETSKTVPFSWDYGYTFNISLFNNVGNATFLGGFINGTIIFADKNQNPIDNSSYFVRQQYYDLLNREPDQSGWSFWTNNIDGLCGTSENGAICRAAKRVDTSAAFFLSIELQQTGYLVYRTYKAAFGNLPGAPVPIKMNEFLTDTQQIGNGVIVGQSGWEDLLETNKQNFMNGLVQRSQFTSAFPTSMSASEFVDALYTNAGLIPTSAPSRLQAISEFDATTPSDPAARARALRDVAEDPMLTQQEFNRAFVLMQYFGYLRRDPNSAPDIDFSGYTFWLNKLNQFNGDYNAAEMVKAFMNSSEYRQRFGP